MIKKTFFTFCCLVALCVTNISITEAQSASSISVTPENPTPYSTVTLRLQALSFDVNTALITWKVNGVTVLLGEGEKTLSLSTRGVGESDLVVVTAENKQGFLIEETITITPSAITLIYEAPKSHTPYFYEGRSFAGKGGSVKVSALPSLSDNGQIIPPSTLSYTWYINGEIRDDLSGRGKQSALFRLDFLRTNNEVRVVVRTPNGNSSSKTISIKPYALEPIVYEYSEIFGTLLNKPVRGRLEITSPIALSIEPYFVSSREEKPSIYTWILDGINITPFDSSILGLTPTKNSSGVKNLTVRVEGPDKRLQSSEVRAQIIFDTR